MAEREELEDSQRTLEGQECQGCLRAAFYWRRKPEWGEVIQPEMAWTEDEGKMPSAGARISCQYCGREVQEWQLTPDFTKSFTLHSH